MRVKKSKLKFYKAETTEFHTEITISNEANNDDFIIVIQNEYFTDKCFVALKEWDIVRDGWLVRIEKDEDQEDKEVLVKIYDFKDVLANILDEDEKLTAELCEFVCQALIKDTEWR